MDLVIFWVLAPVSVGSAVLMLLQRNAVHSALLLIVNFFTLAVFFLLLDAPFLFVVQIIVYAGAIMVLFLFVIMLLGVGREESLVERLKGQRTLAVLLGLGVTLEVFFAIRLSVGLSRGALPDFTAANAGGNVRGLARVLFTSYVFPFEVTSLLLIIAAIAAMVLARKREGPGGIAAPLAERPEEAANAPGGSDVASARPLTMETR